MPDKAFNDLHSVINKVLKKYDLSDKVKNEQIILNWTKIAGEKISKMCQPVSLHNGELTIRVKNKLWKDELAQRPNDLLNLLDKQLGKSLVKKINII